MKLHADHLEEKLEVQRKSITLEHQKVIEQFRKSIDTSQLPAKIDEAASESDCDEQYD